MHVTRFVTATVGAAVLTIGLSGLVSAQTGQTGNYVFTDSSEEHGAICRYAHVSESVARIYRINVKPPKAWWPDRSADSNTEHGTVGWRAFIDHGANGSWSLLKKTTIQKATAYEGYPGGYNEDDKAPFATRKVDITASSVPAGHNLRVRLKVWWYRNDGSVLGSISHTVLWYGEKIGDGVVMTNDVSCRKSFVFN